MDYTFKKYKEILSVVGKGEHTVRAYLEKGKNQKYILRHDVDRLTWNAENMAEIENLYSITSTYYFRYPSTYNKQIISRIHALGHEIGFHYEVLDKTNGNYQKAIKIFEKEMELFSDWNIKTIESRKQWNEIWKIVLNH